MAGRIYIGTSGWSYKEWRANFYPRGLPSKAELGHYARTFPTVELNATFYRLPSEKAIQSWSAAAPPGFLYAVKGSRVVTHYKRLLPGARSFNLLLGRIAALGPHLGPVLWQLPPTLPLNLPRLEDFLASLPRTMRHALEVRHPSWMNDEVLALLRTYDVAMVAVSSGKYEPHRVTTTDFTYVRFHGLAGGARHDYTRAELSPWAAFLRDCAARGLRGYAYFNNDLNTRAPNNAALLMEMVGDSTVRGSPVPRARPASRSRAGAARA